MTRSEVIDLVHIDGTSEYVFSPALSEADMDWIDVNPSIVEPIVAARKNAAGFLVSFPPALEQILSHEKTPMLSIDSETTHLTKHSPAIKMTGKSHIGGKPYSAYLARFPCCTINTAPRMRVLAIQAIGGPCPGEYVFDLDAMSATDRQRLIDTVLDGHVLVGHNVIGFDGFWLFQESIKRPLMWLDTLILTRQCKPQMLTYMNYDAALGNEEHASVAIAALHKRGGEGGATLEYLAQSLGLPALNKTYQRPENWCVSVLSPEHLAYVLSDIHTPLKILEHIFGTLELDEIKRQIKEEFPAYVTFMRAASITARAKGVPFSEAEATKLTAEKRAKLSSVVEDMRRFPEFGDDALKVLADPIRSSTSKVVLKALGAHAATYGLVLPKTDKGGISISGKAMTLAGLTETLPCWQTLSKINNEKKGIGMIEQYRKYAKQDGRLHCMVQFITAAGRASCSEPNLQGTPREPALRGLVAADTDYEILGLDYSSIELRIAACNAERAIAWTRESLQYSARGDYFNFYTKQCKIAMSVGGEPYPDATTRPEGMPDDEWAKNLPALLIRYFAENTLNKTVQTLTMTFQLGLDPHLVTALHFVKEAGEILIPGDIADWLASQSPEERSRLKKIYSEQRQRAKAVNFGLLYGMTAKGLHRYGITSYGLTWTLAEATAARDAWFKLYPELGLWHMYTTYAQSRKLSQDEVLLFNKYSGAVEKSKFPARLFTTSTLTGRPIVVLGEVRQALSYQGQGSGADILALAISKLPDHLRECFILPVHDEILLHCPKALSAKYKDELRAIMIEAGQQVLGDLVPIEVEGDPSPVWKK